MTTRLIIIGAGPVGQQLAKLAGELDFDVSVLDERASLLVADNFPPQTKLLPGELDTVLGELTTTPDDYIAIVAQVWSRDQRALEMLVHRPLKYLGLIGCQRKLGELFPALEATGIERAALDKVRAPIGLYIGSRTPTEIAISICAELIAVRSGKR
ncbi:MAG TPA: XdhC family protein [Pirellulaceae bacterium]|nr:XdhC family protein [Pirellulaceae bacterium]